MPTPSASATTNILVTAAGLVRGETLPILERAGFRETSLVTLTSELIGLVAAYREEERQLFPSIYIINTLDALKVIAPGTAPIELGALPITSATNAETILKHCATLATDRWSVFIALEAHDTKIRYGVFRTQRNCLSTSSDEAMLEIEDGYAVVLVRNRANLVSEIVTSKNDRASFRFSSAGADLPTLPDVLHKLSRSIGSAIETDHAVDFINYVARVLIKSIQLCHGTIVAVADVEEIRRVQSDHQDAIWLSPAIPWYNQYKSAKEDHDTDSLADLEATESLLSNMLKTDGAVVLSSAGTILGFRLFLKATDTEKMILPDYGGSRRRAFAVLKQRLNSGFVGAFYRSQDGASSVSLRGDS